MNDIRGSGAPVQDAAVVMLMWQKQKSAEGTTIAINIAKNRSGANGIIDLKLLGSKYKFLEMTNREEK
jgi:replicative DNA helicase